MGPIISDSSNYLRQTWLSGLGLCEVPARRVFCNLGSEGQGVSRQSTIALPRSRDLSLLMYLLMFQNQSRAATRSYLASGHMILDFG